MPGSFAAVLLTVVLGTDPVPSVSPFALSRAPADLDSAGKIDELVFASMRRLSIRPRRFAPTPSLSAASTWTSSARCPPPTETREFLADTTRTNGGLIDRLLERDELPTTGR